MILVLKGGEARALKEGLCRHDWAILEVWGNVVKEEGIVMMAENFEECLVVMGARLRFAAANNCSGYARREVVYWQVPDEGSAVDIGEVTVVVDSTWSAAVVGMSSAVGVVATEGVVLGIVDNTLGRSLRKDYSHIYTDWDCSVRSDTPEGVVGRETGGGMGRGPSPHCMEGS